MHFLTQKNSAEFWRAITSLRGEVYAVQKYVPFPSLFYGNETQFYIAESEFYKCSNHFYTYEFEYYISENPCYNDEIQFYSIQMKFTKLKINFIFFHLNLIHMQMVFAHDDKTVHSNESKLYTWIRSLFIFPIVKYCKCFVSIKIDWLRSSHWHISIVYFDEDSSSFPRQNIRWNVPMY